MFKDTPEGQTHFCEACEQESRNLTASSKHTCGKPLQPSKEEGGTYGICDCPEKCQLHKEEPKSKVNPDEIYEKWENDFGDLLKELELYGYVSYEKGKKLREFIRSEKKKSEEFGWRKGKDAGYQHGMDIGAEMKKEDLRDVLDKRNKEIIEWANKNYGYRELILKEDLINYLK